jgi:hypothetical protein
MRHGGLVWLLRLAALVALWLALTDSRNVQELMLGLGVVALAAAAASVVERPRPSETLARLAVPARLGLRRCAAPVWRLVRDSAIISAATVRALAARRTIHGRFRAVPYRPGRARRGVGGRILTESLGSLQANRYVVGVDEDRQLVVVHELRPSDEPIDPFG